MGWRVDCRQAAAPDLPRLTVPYSLLRASAASGGPDVGDRDTIGNNLRATLHTQLRGKSCRPHGPDLKVRAARDGRYPDALVDGGPHLPGGVVCSGAGGGLRGSIQEHGMDRSEADGRLNRSRRLRRRASRRAPRPVCCARGWRQSSRYRSNHSNSTLSDPLPWPIKVLKCMVSGQTRRHEFDMFSYM